MQYKAAAKRCHNLRYGDSAVEQAEISTDVSARKSVGQYGERHSQHCGPGAAHKGVAHAEQILVFDKVNRDKACRADKKAERVGEFAAAEPCECGGPQHGGYGLDSEEVAVPVAGVLVLGGGRVEHRFIVEVISSALFTAGRADVWSRTYLPVPSSMLAM